MQKKYRPLDSDPAFLRVDPTPDSVIVVADRKQHTVTPASTVPPDKESCKLDGQEGLQYSRSLDESSKCNSPPRPL